MGCRHAPIMEAMPQLSEAERIFVATGAVPADLTVDMSEQEFMDYMPAEGPDFG
jgi:hypothetical protein